MGFVAQKNKRQKCLYVLWCKEKLSTTNTKGFSRGINFKRKKVAIQEIGFHIICQNNQKFQLFHSFMKLSCRQLNFLNVKESS